VYARELATDGTRFAEEDLARALEKAWRDIRANPPPDRYGGVRGEPEFWRAFLNTVRGELDRGVVSAEAFDRLARHFRDPGSWAIYPDVEPALAELSKRNLALAVVSNWDSNLPALLDGLGLAPRFAQVLVSSIEAVGKPEREIFLRACARLRVAPAEALHVGDSPVEDYEGARSAGLSALLLDRAGRHAASADRIRSLSEVADRVAAGPGGAAPV